ncbi:hypothetical protein BGX28_004593 [Mortierella sp. GBA30]|nr:hypothetical protein BGX28_004593 [Mortierella sp. GBA30]
MAILDYSKDGEKSVSIHFHTQELGPEGQPLYYHTPENAAVIQGHVEFRTVRPTKGSDIVLTFDARAESKWTEHYGQTTVSFHQISRLQEKTWEIKLNRTDSKTIAPGVTRYDFEVQLDHGLPPSIHGKRGWFHYRFKAHLRRDFPHRDMAAKQCVWVYSSSIKASEVQEPKLYKQVWNDILPFNCTLPSDVLYHGQLVPLTVQFEPFLDSCVHRGQELIVLSAAVKLKQYTTLIEKSKLLTKKREEKKVVMNLPVFEDWPQTSQGFTKTIMVELPGARQLAASIESETLIKSHCLKLIMMVRTNVTTEKEAKELRMEMDVKITSPRPEHIKNINAHIMAPPAYQDIESEDDDAMPSDFRRASSSSSGYSRESNGGGDKPSFPQDRKRPVSIPEAASSGGTITFKILVATATSESTYPVFRTFPQVRWLHHKLQTTFVDHVIPPLPEPLSEKLSEDVDQVEQKRVQVERFLQRICLRAEFATSDAVLWFVGTEMTHLDSVDSKRATLGFLRFDNIIKPSYDRGMRMYRPTENVDELGDATMEVLSSKHRLGDGQRIDNRERHQALDEEMQVFGVLTDDMRLSIRRQVRAETFHFMDMVQEYKSMLQGLKDVMNSRTDRLSEYVSATKRVAKKQSQMEQAIQRSAAAPAGDLVDRAKLSLDGANAQLDETREEFKRSQVVVTRELLRYEKDKAKEWQSSVQDYAAKQIMYEKEKLEALERAWDSIRDLRTNAATAEGSPIGGDTSRIRGSSTEQSSRSRSYWPSGLGSPFAPDLDPEQRMAEDTKADVVATNPSGTEFSPDQERLPQNAGTGGSHTSGYNSGYNSGYSSADPDEGVRSDFPSTKLSRSGSGARSKGVDTAPASTVNSRKGSAAGIAAGGTSGIGGSAAVQSSSALAGTDVTTAAEATPKMEVLRAESEDRNKDGYDPLMVRPGFTD